MDDRRVYCPRGFRPMAANYRHAMVAGNFDVPAEAHIVEHSPAGLQSLCLPPLDAAEESQ